MANKKISDLNALGTTPAVGDIIPITDVSGTPTTKSVTVANLMLAAPVQSVNATNVTAAGALMDSEVTNLGQVKAFDSSDYATAAQGTLADSALQPTSVINDLSDVIITSASNEDVIKFNGTSFVNGQVSVDVNTPLTTALRGTDNPHIGAYPNQSFKVVDNPSKSVMLGSDPDGKIYVFNSSGKSAISTGISAVEDSAEPDIEITTTTGTYSLITGDSDAKDPNGLPIQQGFNAPNIGVFSSPLLISGGSIA